MALVRWSPIDEFTAFREEMNRLFENLLRRGDGRESAWFAGTWVPQWTSTRQTRCLS